MKSVEKFILFGTLLFLIINVSADCVNEKSDSEEGDVKTWFKNLGCKIQKGAEDIGESAKPWAEKIGNSAKEFGSSVANKYGEIKHKLTDDNVAASSTPTPAYNGPTEKVPLAPLAGDANNVPVATDSNPSISETPKSIDDRFLFQPTECPSGHVKDHNGHCRPKV